MNGVQRIRFAIWQALAEADVPLLRLTGAGQDTRIIISGRAEVVLQSGSMLVVTCDDEGTRAFVLAEVPPDYEQARRGEG